MNALVQPLFHIWVTFRLVHSCTLTANKGSGEMQPLPPFIFALKDTDKSKVKEGHISVLDYICYLSKKEHLLVWGINIFG